jgi:peptidoglycan/LPS O-acetylase OafA/YrhL
MLSLAQPSCTPVFAPVHSARLWTSTGTQASVGTPSRIVALDGVRGVLAVMVVVSHYIGEVPHGIKDALVGWIAVKMFFVLSGFLMAKLIMDHINSPNFFAVFYIRRACRTLPVYVVMLAIVFGSAVVFQGQHWMEADRMAPLWRYLTFTQTFEMIARGDYGSDWLTPTWTLTVEEQFYLVAPVLCLIAGRRHLLKVLIVAACLSIAFRFLSYGFGVLPTMSALVLLPAVAHAMFLGMIAAIVLASGQFDWRRHDLMLRAAPIAILVVVMLLKAIDGDGSALFQLIGAPLVSVGCALYLMSIVRGAPEAKRMHAPALRMLGQLSFSIYLLHMPVLGLMHGVLLGDKPDIATLAQFAVTLAAMPVTLLLAVIVNRTIELPMIAYGRQWTFARPAR